MKVFFLLLLVANLVYGGWHLLVGHPQQAAVATQEQAGGERLQLLSER